MTRYVWRDGAWRDRDGALMPVPVRDGLCIPAIRSDIEDYTSPIDGKHVSSRSGQRYDLEKNDCVLAPPGRKFSREEYTARKAGQAKELAKRKAS